MSLLTCIANQLFLFLNRKVYKAFLLSSQNIEQTQKEILFSILRKNENSAFGMNYHFKTISSVKDLQRLIPIMDYEDYQEWIEMIMKGESNVLCSEKVKYLALSSGTTSPSKYIPFTEALKTEFSSAVNVWIYTLLRQFPKIKRGSQFWIVSPASTADVPESKVPIGFEPDSAYFGKLEKRLIRAILAVPEEFAQIKSSENYLYAISLFLLRKSNLRLISVWNPGMLISILQFIKEHHKNLIRDIKKGEANLPDAQIDNDYTIVSPFLKKLPKRAKFLARINFEEENFNCNIIWTRLQLISCWTDSWAKAFLDEIQSLFPGVRIQGKGLLATEGVVSITLKGILYPVLAVNSHFYEFRDLNTNAIHQAHELVKDKQYEVIITTGGGFYRYNLHDIVKIKGFYCSLPLMEFVGKSDKVSDLTGEKLNESHVEDIIDKLRQKYFKKNGIAYLVAVKREEAYAYVFFVDGKILKAKIEVNLLLQELDEQLSSNYHYLHSRRMKQLAAPGLLILKPEQVKAYFKLKTSLRSTSKYSRLMTDINEIPTLNHQVLWMEKVEKKY